MRDAVELAARFIRRGDYVLANDVLRDEFGAELGDPAQIQYCSFGSKDILVWALKHTAEMFGCLTYMEDNTRLNIVGEKEAIDNLEEARRVALSDEYGYEDQLNKYMWGPSILGITREQWNKDYVIGFFDGLIGNNDLGLFGMFNEHPHVFGILDGTRSAQRYAKENKGC